MKMEEKKIKINLNEMHKDCQALKSVYYYRLSIPACLSVCNNIHLVHSTILVQNSVFVFLFVRERRENFFVLKTIYLIA
jgi:hypothetical protein